MNEQKFSRLKAYRAERDLTQKEMANLLGMNVVTYRKKENGERDFTLSEVARAKSILGLDPEYYFFYKFSDQMVTKEKLN